MDLSKDLSPHFRAWLDPLRKHFTAYRFCWVLVGLSFLIAWNRGIALLYAVVALTLAAMLLSHLLAWANVRALRVVRERVHVPAPGDAPVIRYRLSAPGRRHFLLIDEPRLATLGATLVPHVDRSATVERDLNQLHRGVYPLAGLRVSSAYPFGLLTRQRQIAQTAQEIVVYPRLHEVRLPPPQSRAYAAEVDNVAHRRRGWDEFAGVREQRPGESLKHVHWRASARQDRLMVKEYETLDTPGMLIVLPQQKGFDQGRAPHSCFEYAVELAASLARAASRAGHPVRCLSFGKRNRDLRVAAHTVELSPMLEWFAHATHDGTTDLHDAVERALRTLGDPGWLVSFRHDGDPGIGQHARARHLDFVFDAPSFRHAQAPDGEPSVVVSQQPDRYRVACYADLPALFT